jgi:hypothetical protein
MKKFKIYSRVSGYKAILIALLLLAINTFSFGQNVSINKDGATPDPSALLDVSDTAKGVLIPRMTETQRLAIVSPATGLLVFQTNLDSGFYFNQGSAIVPSWLRIQTELDSSKWERASDTSIYYNNKYVGIGISYPNAPLEIDNSIFNKKISLYTDSPNEHQFLGFGTGFGELRYQVDKKTTDHVFYSAIDTDSSGELMRITGDTLVGIGTNSPEGLLHLYGKGLFGGGARLVFGDDYQSTTQQWNAFIGEAGWNSNTDTDIMQYHARAGHYFTTGTLNGTTPDTILNISPLGRVYVGNEDLGQRFSIRTEGAMHNLLRMQADSGQTGLWFTNDSANWALFSDQAIGTALPQGSFGIYGGKVGQPNAVRLIIDKDGKVGIGTTNPRKELHVQGSIIAGSTSLASLPTGITYALLMNNNGESLLSSSSGSKSELLKINGSAIRFTSGVSNFSNPTVMFIDTLGSVGIGTETPTQKLDVNGGAEINYLGINGSALSNVPLRITAAANNLAMRFDQNDGTEKWEIFADANSLNFCESNVACNRLVLETGGDIGIGRFPSFKLDVNGSIRANATVYASDSRLKTDIIEIKNVLSSLDEITGVYHYWDTVSFPERNYTEKKTIGVIAQDIQKVYPELVQEDEEGYLSVDYPKFTAVLLQAIKEQQKEIELLKASQSDAKLQQIENENLRRRLEKLEEILIKK